MIHTTYLEGYQKDNLYINPKAKTQI